MKNLGPRWLTAPPGLSPREPTEVTYFAGADHVGASCWPHGVPPPYRLLHVSADTGRKAHDKPVKKLLRLPGNVAPFFRPASRLDGGV